MNFITDRQMTLDMLSDRMTRAFENETAMKRSVLSSCAGKLSALNPLSVIARGYSAVYSDTGALVKKIDDVKPGDRIKFRTIGGEAKCTVDEVEKDDSARNTDGV